MLDFSLPRVKISHNGRGLLLPSVLRCRGWGLNGGVPRALRLRRRRGPHHLWLIGAARRPRVAAQDAARGRPGTVGGGRGGRCQRQRGSLLLLLLLLLLSRDSGRGGITIKKACSG